MANGRAFLLTTGCDCLSAFLKHRKPRRQSSNGMIMLLLPSHSLPLLETAISKSGPQIVKENKRSPGLGRLLPRFWLLLHSPSGRVEVDGSSDDAAALGGWQRSAPTVFTRSKSTFRLAPLHSEGVTCVRGEETTTTKQMATPCEPRAQPIPGTPPEFGMRQREGSASLDPQGGAGERAMGVGPRRPGFKSRRLAWVWSW